MRYYYAESAGIISRYPADGKKGTAFDLESPEEGWYGAMVDENYCKANGDEPITAERANQLIEESRANGNG